MGHNILYVDDESHNLDAFARAFFDADFVDRVYTAVTPAEGEKILADKEIAAVITDQRMPGMTGTEFLARIIPRHPNPVRLILTGYTDVKDIIDAINRGHVYFFITKPWDVEELKLTVRRALEHYETVQELRRKNHELAVAYDNLEATHREQVRLYEMVITDDKTGVRNYHFFRIRLGEELDRARRYGKDLALVMMDIDEFKALNDSHGPLVGDAVLKELAQLLVMGQRSVDVVARYGGEEFALVLPETGLAGARTIAERLRQRVAEHAFVGAGGQPLKLTLSAGIAAYPHADVTSKEELIQRADRGLFVAKAQGKNRVGVDE